MHDLLSITMRAIISLVTLFLVTKMLGKKQVSQLSLFDYVIGISIGNFAAEMTVNLDSNILHGTIAVIIFGLIAYIISIGTMKSILLRRFFSGVPTLIIEDGKFLKEGLKKVKFDINDFLEQAREQGYFDISEIAYAVMESSGKISIMPKSEYSAVINKDMKIKKEKASMPASIIIDGNIMEENLKKYGKTRKWLEQQLKNKHKTVDSIFLATIDKNDNLVLFDQTNHKATDVLE
mgnify:CR=1 FL=1